MKSALPTMRWMLAILACILAIALCGCEGSDTRKAITGAVEDLGGQKVIDKGEQMKRDIDRAMKEKGKRVLRMDSRDTGVPGEDPDAGSSE